MNIKKETYVGNDVEQETRNKEEVTLEELDLEIPEELDLDVLQELDFGILQIIQETAKELDLSCEEDSSNNRNDRKNEKKEYYILKRKRLLNTLSTIKNLKRKDSVAYEHSYGNLEKAINFLKELTDEKKMVSVAFGIEKALSLSIEEMDIALLWLEDLGYRIYKGKVENKKIRVLTTNEIPFKEIFNKQKVFGLNAVKNRLSFGNDALVGTITLKQTVVDKASIVCTGEEQKMDATKVKICKNSTILEAFGVKIGDVFDITKTLRNNDGDAYKYIVYHPQLKMTLGFPHFFVEAL